MCVAVRCSVLQSIAVCCSVLQDAAVARTSKCELHSHANVKLKCWSVGVGGS